MVERQDTQTTVDLDVGELDFEYLNQYLTSVCFTLLNVNKDLFYKELHDPNNQKTLKSFATEKNFRSLLIAKVEKGKGAMIGDVETSVNQSNTSQSDQQKSIADTESDLTSNYEDEGKDGKNVEIRFSQKVTYYGQQAHTIAFLKRSLFT